MHSCKLGRSVCASLSQCLALSLSLGFLQIVPLVAPAHQRQCQLCADSTIALLPILVQMYLVALAALQWSCWEMQRTRSHRACS